MRALSAAGVLAGLLAVAVPARADVAACVSASEDGQRARATGKLRQAREHFLVCGAKACPTLVRQDCAQWTGELAGAIPTVAFGARDRQGRDLFEVKVTMDQEVLVERLDGKSVAVDPGKHTFRFEATGFAPKVVTALVKEGERARLLEATLDPASGAPEPAPSSGGFAPPAPPLPPPEQREQEHTALPWIVAGVGAAGVAVGAVLFFTTPDLPANCDSERRTCARVVGQSPQDLERQQNDAALSDEQPKYAAVIGGVGLVMLAVGLVWHFLEPTGPAGAPRSQVARAPWRVTF